MANVPNFVIPKPPDKADLNVLQKWANDMYSFLVTNWQTGIQPPFFSQDQIDQMTPTTLTQAGKIFFNNDTGKFMGGEVVAGELAVKTFTTS